MAKKGESMAKQEAYQEKNTLMRLVNDMRASPQLLHDVMFDTAKALDKLDYLDERERMALANASPALILGSMVEIARLEGCGHTCSSSCTATCGKSCTYTTNLVPEELATLPVSILPTALLGR
jgi:hypothetical protein